MTEEEIKILKSIDKSLKDLLNIFLRLEKDYSSNPEYLKMIENEKIINKMPP
jgi:hypothetical protein